MKQQPSYEFEEDDSPKPERKRFIPGLDDVQAAPLPVANAPQPGGAAAPAPRAQAAAPGTGPTAQKAAGPRPSVPAAVQPAADDADIKPGSGKDLWPCPHCGTKNKPSRTACRSCGKSPDAAKDRPFWFRPAFLGGVVGGFLVVLLLWFVTRPDFSLKTPGTTALDLGAAKGLERELVGLTFTPQGRISICGRIIGQRLAPGVDRVQDVILLLGKATEAEVDAAAPTFNQERIDDVPAGAKILHLITSEKLDLTKGAWLSLVGDYGQLSSGAQLIRSTESGYTVAVEQIRQ
jgi:hypothetical protein